MPHVQPGQYNFSHETKEKGLAQFFLILIWTLTTEQSLPFS